MFRQIESDVPTRLPEFRGVQAGNIDNTPNGAKFPPADQGEEAHPYMSLYYPLFDPSNAEPEDAPEPAEKPHECQQRVKQQKCIRTSSLQKRPVEYATRIYNADSVTADAVLSSRAPLPTERLRSIQDERRKTTVKNNAQKKKKKKTGKKGGRPKKKRQQSTKPTSKPKQTICRPDEALSSSIASQGLNPSVTGSSRGIGGERKSKPVGNSNKKKTKRTTVELVPARVSKRIAIRKRGSTGAFSWSKAGTHPDPVVAASKTSPRPPAMVTPKSSKRVVTTVSLPGGAETTGNPLHEQQHSVPPTPKKSKSLQGKKDDSKKKPVPLATRSPSSKTAEKKTSPPLSPRLCETTHDSNLNHRSGKKKTTNHEARLQNSIPDRISSFAVGNGDKNTADDDDDENPSLSPAPPSLQGTNSPAAGNCEQGTDQKTPSPSPTSPATGSSTRASTDMDSQEDADDETSTPSFGQRRIGGTNMRLQRQLAWSMNDRTKEPNNSMDGNRIESCDESVSRRYPKRQQTPRDIYSDTCNFIKQEDNSSKEFSNGVNCDEEDSESNCNENNDRKKVKTHKTREGKTYRRTVRTPREIYPNGRYPGVDYEKLAKERTINEDYSHDVRTDNGEVRDQIWNEKFRELHAHFKKNKSHFVDYTRDNIHLIHWVGMQRQDLKNKTMHPDRFRRLNSIGFVWNGREGSLTWEETHEKLLAFRETYGHVDVPKQWKEDPQLGLWCRHQRALYNHERHPIRPERRDLLESIGFKWDVSMITWKKRYQELSDFRKKHAHFRVPKDYPNRLARWVRLRREEFERGTLPDEQMTMLNNIGFDWKIETE